MTNCRASPWPSSREPLRLCYGCISGLPPSQLQPLQIDGGNCHLICCKTRRKSKQTLAHVLSHCQAALQHGIYNTQHDRFLDILFTNLQLHLPPGTKVVADLAGQPYTLPGSLLSDLRPDLVVHFPGELHLLELTVCREANFVSANSGRRANTCTCWSRHIVWEHKPHYAPRSRSDAEASSTARASTTSLPWHQPALKYRSH